MGSKTYKSLVSFEGAIEDVGVLAAHGLKGTMRAKELASKIDRAVKGIAEDKTLAKPERLLRQHEVVSKGLKKLREEITRDLEARTRRVGEARNRLPTARLKSMAKGVPFAEAREVGEMLSRKGYAWLLEAPAEMQARAIRAVELGFGQKKRLENILDKAAGHEEYAAFEKEQRGLEVVVRSLEAVERRAKTAFPPAELQRAKREAEELRPFGED